MNASTQVIPEVGKYANRRGWSDVTPFEIVGILNTKTIEVREMDATLDPTWKPEFIVGGFAGHCTNQNSQRWIYVSNPSIRPIRIHLSKRGWGKGKFQISDTPHKFYDYNF